MITRALTALKQAQDHAQTAVHVAADLAEALGLPPRLCGMLRRSPPEDPYEHVSYEQSNVVSPLSSPPAVASQPSIIAPTPVANKTVQARRARGTSATQKTTKAPAKKAPAKKAPAKTSVPKAVTKRKIPTKKTGASTTPSAARRKALLGTSGNGHPTHIKALEATTAISGSTYLARIIWALGIADIEKLGALKPAEMARMVISRSPVSLDPPNIARYIRRKNPSTLSIERSEGNSHFYALNTEGKKLFTKNYVRN